MKAKEKTKPYPFSAIDKNHVLDHCGLGPRPEEYAEFQCDCPLEALARTLIQAEGEFVKSILEDEACTVIAVFGLGVEWRAERGARWTGFWTVPRPHLEPIHQDVGSFNLLPQEIYGDFRPTALARRSIVRVWRLVAVYTATVAARAAEVNPDSDEFKSLPPWWA